ncbi:class I SAM-dependent methyltransferase [Leptolyngbya sp. NIES-2104]|uniref:class I SAM-dependent methyltransferase n=1 Tax=Leptolyngbya sp. NIES-2104 TaxID=1552121 RepID=UPI0006EC822B|nr:methyltransferase domain-containing protein [Leptolyngbya sp. NIES-2104]GAP98217.1 SAM-dependent methyltransferase [Leptolyngbya sp. NIES-2104]
METNVRQQYNRMARIYDRVWSRYISKSLSFLKDWAQLDSTRTVLDVACGTGTFERLVLLEHPTQQITGIDLSEKMLEIAEEKCRDYPNVSFHIASVTALPFSDRTFDTVISASAFHYFENPSAALLEMKRVLKPDGELIILDWCKDDWLCRIYDFVLKRFDSAHEHCYTQAEFHHLLNETGFQIQRATRFRIGLAWELMIATATKMSIEQTQVPD